MFTFISYVIFISSFSLLTIGIFYGLQAIKLI
uniref:Cytochrome b6-f complex subunit 6 n=1 Tax=Rhodogorgon sp. TaxID=2485824 RepID=A0A3G3MI50_9FLOR|nr:cytochrome b6-f complex subunit VI [Rhodogorgon sp.]